MRIVDSTRTGGAASARSHSLDERDLGKGSEGSFLGRAARRLSLPLERLVASVRADRETPPPNVKAGSSPVADPDWEHDYEEIDELPSGPGREAPQQASGATGSAAASPAYNALQQPAPV